MPGAFLLCAALLCGPAWADVHEGFEAPSTSWKIEQTDCGGLELLRHLRDTRQQHGGKRSEHLHLRAGAGTFVYATQSIPPTQVIDEFQPSLWVKADRAGIQMLVRVVLPESKNPKNGEPLKMLLPGEILREAGVWRRLTCSGLRDELLRRELPKLRSRFGAWVNPRNAYVDLIVLNAFGGPGHTRLWIDDLTYSVFAPVKRVVDNGEVRLVQGLEPIEPRGHRRETPRVAVHGDMLMIGDRALMARIIEHNGEPFAWLQSLGFNAILLPGPATRQQLDEAAQLGIWLIAPPPRQQITPQHDVVMAWRLGESLGSRELQPVSQAAAELRRRDLRSQRPLMCGPASRFWEYRRAADVFLLEKNPLGGPMELTDLAKWWRDTPADARLAAPVWAGIPTQHDRRLNDQVTALGAHAALEWTYVEPDQIRAMTYHAIASGVRGICFRSRQPLDRRDVVTQLRAKTLQTLNLELELLEPWVASGVAEGDLSTANRQLRISMLRTERSQMLLITRTGSAQQFVIGPGERQGATSFITSAISSSSQAYRASFATLERLRATRVPGGFRISLEDGELTTLLMLSQNPQAINHLARTLQRNGPRIAQLRHDTTRLHWQRTAAIVERLAALGAAVPQARGKLEEARRHLARGAELLNNRDIDWANALTNQAMSALADVRRGHWEHAVRRFTFPTSSPLCADFALLPEHWSLTSRVATLNWSSNVLSAGGFENLDQMLKAGWRRSTQPPKGASAHVELSLTDPYSGRRALRMATTADDSHQYLGERPIQSIQSSAVPVRQGQIVRIHGWVKIDRPLQGDPRGLRLYDSLAGADFGERVTVTSGWREFTLYRAAPRDDYLILSFDLYGQGEVLLDDVTVAVANPTTPTPRQPPPERVPPPLRGGQ